MFGSIFSFEVTRWYRSLAAYIYFLILFLVTFLFCISAGGIFNGVNISTGGEKVWINSPSVIDGILSVLNQYVGIIIIVAIIGNAVLKDFSNNTYSFIFTTPVYKFNYLMGRFSAAIFVTLIIMLAPALGMMTAYEMPGLVADKLGPFVLSAYWQNYWQVIIPNTILLGSIFFSLSLIARDVFVIWVSLIVIFILMGVSSSYLSSLEHEKLVAILEPFGSNAKDVVTKYWTVYQKNHNLIPLTGVFLINRIVWLGVSSGILAVGYSYFSFTSSPRFIFSRRKKLLEASTPAIAKIDLSTAIPFAKRSFTSGNYLKNLWGLSVNECRTLLRNTFFRIILLFGMLFLLLVSSQVGKLYDTGTFPVTDQVILFLGNTFQLFIVILTILFAGDLVWKGRDNRMSNILDTLPVPNWVFYLSKLFGLWFMQAILLLVIIASGLMVQTYRGYHHYELGLYFEYLFGFRLINLWLLAVLAIMIQTLVSNRYVGYFITVLFYIWNISFALLALKHKLFVYGSDPGFIYSDMNGFGHAIYPFFVFKYYWASLAVCLAVFSSLMWARGTETKWKFRWRQATGSTSRAGWIAITLALISFTASGAFIYYNTNILNKFHTSWQQENISARYERQYKKFEFSPQPKITTVKLDVDIYPKERNIFFTGTYILKNKTTQRIDSIHVLLNEGAKMDKIDFSVPATLVSHETDFDYKIFRLSSPLQPGDSITMSFKTSEIAKGFKQNFTGLNTAIYNGTFVNNREMLPSIGYNSEGEIADNATRKKHGLPFRRTSNPINDVRQYQMNPFGKDADFINFEATVSTEPDQIAIAPGYLQNEWIKDDRRYFHYKMDNKILNFYAFLSARYLVKKEKWNNVNLEIYYQPGHEYNLDRMFNGMKKSLTYYSAHFTPYQHKQVRILEFPQYQTFAQSFPNTIPFSEGIGFIADVSDSDHGAVDYPFYVTAHEMAHQWFAHQLVGADVEGVNMMSESLAQYGSITVLEKEYGEEKVRKFLHYEMDKYLAGRSLETEKEKPLALVDDGQGTILYQKGGIVFHALSKYIGEDSLNHALQRMLIRYSQNCPPYPTTANLVDEIRKSTPDSMQYFVTDVFDKIILYDNKITDAKVTHTGSQYKIDFTVDSKKISADTSGREKPIPSDDYIEIGVYAKNSVKLYLNRYKLKTGVSKLSVIVNQLPERVIIDPRELLMDKDLGDNDYKLKIESK